MSDVTLDEFLKGINPEFKPSITINRSEGYIEAFYEDCSYESVLCNIGEIYYKIGVPGHIIGWRMPLRMNEAFDITFR